jgi:hypothetical protein
MSLDQRIGKLEVHTSVRGRKDQREEVHDDGLAQLIRSDAIASRLAGELYQRISVLKAHRDQNGSILERVEAELIQQGYDEVAVRGFLNKKA